jgi:hypothetical protein
MSRVEVGGVVALSIGGVVLVGILVGGAVLLTLRLKSKEVSVAPNPPVSSSAVPNLPVPSSAAPLAAPVLPQSAAPAMPSAPSAPPVVLGNGLVQTPGGVVQTAPPSSQTLAQPPSEKALTEQQANEWRRADKIRELKRELDNVWNDIRIVSSDLREIDSRPVEGSIVAAVAEQHVTDCIKSTDGWALNFGGYQVCEGKRNVTTEGYDRILAERWKQRLAEIRAPQLARLGNLNSRQKSLIANLAELGVVVPKLVDYPVAGDAGSSSAGSGSSWFDRIFKGATA